MIHSMTGYSALSRELPQGSLQLELKSVNSRFLDIQFRIADDLRALEPQFRELIGAKIARGKVDCRLSFGLRPLADNSALLNPDILGRLVTLSAQVKSAMVDVQPLRVAEVLAWPGILGDNTASIESLRGAAREMITKALQELGATRAREGAKLVEMIRERTAAMRKRLIAIEPLVPAAIAAYQERLSAKLREVLAGGEEERIRQEIAVFSLKVDVAEELSRLAAHLDEVERVLAAGGQAGKRLDFLMQELNREANTLGSKSISKELSDTVIEFKLAIEQMREQVQNLE